MTNEEGPQVPPTAQGAHDPLAPQNSPPPPNPQIPPVPNVLHVPQVPHVSQATHEPKAPQALEVLQHPAPHVPLLN